jgi:hypothetical protein
MYEIIEKFKKIKYLWKDTLNITNVKVKLFFTRIDSDSATQPIGKLMIHE